MSEPPEFSRLTLVAEDGRASGGYLCVCKDCGARGTVTANGFSGRLPPEVIRKKFTQMGWRISKKARLCPDCKPQLRRVTQAKEPMMAATPTHPTVAPPRQMTPPDRRRVFRAIDDNWDEKKARYIGQMTDRLLGEQLDVPRAWVETVRQESFGEHGHNEAGDKMMGELKNLKGEAERAAAAALDLAQKYEALASQAAGLFQRVRAG